jgi:hemerythrin-like metal-binding protein
MNDLSGKDFREKMASRLSDVGVAQINVEHERLLNLVIDADEIIAKMLGKEGTPDEWESLADVMNDLMNYTKLHFANEEQMLRKSGYPKVAEHMAQHESLVGQLNIHQQKVMSADSSSIGIIRQWLLEWLFIHINNFDMDYKPYMK